MMEGDERRPSSIVQRAMGRTAPETAPQPTKLELHDEIRRVRASAVELGVAELLEAGKATAERTRKQYGRIIRRRQRLDGQGPDLSGVSRSAWYPTRAALSHGAAVAYRAAMKDSDRAQRAGDVAEAFRLAKVAGVALDSLKAVQGAKPPEAQEKGTESARKRLPKGSGARQWQARVYEAATPAMKPAIAVMWATGARPAELETGVDVFRNKAGRLLVRIPGAKVSEQTKAGQPVRVLSIDENTAAGRVLAETLGKAEKLTIQRRAKRIGVDFSEHIRPRLPASWKVSAYSFRHQAAANLKAAKGPDGAEQTAAALGHRTTRSQQAYGTARQSQKGGGAILSAKATHEVKETRGLVVAPLDKRQAPRPS